jgi:hypothetical protein
MRDLKLIKEIHKSHQLLLAIKLCNLSQTTFLLSLELSEHLKNLIQTDHISFHLYTQLSIHLFSLFLLQKRFDLVDFFSLQVFVELHNEGIALFEIFVLVKV